MNYSWLTMLHLFLGIWQRDSVIHRYIHITFHIIFHYGLLQVIEHIFLCYTVRTYCLSSSKLPIYPPPLIISFLCLWVCFSFINKFYWTITYKWYHMVCVCLFLVYFTYYSKVCIFICIVSIGCHWIYTR